MITSAKLPATTKQAPTTAAAPAAAGATTAAAATEPQTSVTSMSPFDSILTLEALAATCNALDAGTPAIGTDLGGSGDLLAADADDSKDADGTDVEDPLAFLAGLLNAAVVTPQPQQQQGAALNGDSDADDSVEGILAGNAHRAVLSATEMPISLQPQAGADDVSAQASPLAASLAGVAADAAASKLLTAIASGPAADPNAPRNDAAQAPDAGTASLARAVELLSHGPRHAAPIARDVIATPVRDPNWAQDLGARVAMMVRGGESSASLQLSPLDLGPVEVNVVVRDSHATVHFGAAQPETRALLEASIPRLREMLASQGFNLMDASVSQGFARQPRAEPPALGRQEVEAESEVRTAARVVQLGLLDTYA